MELRRLKLLGADRLELIDVYMKQIRVLTEYAVPVWEPGLTHAQSVQIERVQVVACSIILGVGRFLMSYNKMKNILGLSSLRERRHILCYNFSKNLLTSEKYRTWFVVNNTNAFYSTRSDKTILKSIPARTTKFQKSPLPFLTDMLNKNIVKYDKSSDKFTFK